MTNNNTNPCIIRTASDCLRKDWNIYSIVVDGLSSSDLVLLRKFKRLRSLKIKSGSYKSIDAQGNASAQTHLTDNGLNVISSLHSLRVLDLDTQDHFTDTGLSYLVNLGELASLSIRYNDCITDVGLAAISRIHSLERLTLQECPNITDRGIEHLAVLTRLTQLDLGGSTARLTDMSMQWICKLSDLELLILDCCALISDEGSCQLSSLTKLSMLSLAGGRYAQNKFTDKTLAAISLLPALETVDISGCPNVSKSAIESFVKNHPRCRLMH